MYVIQRYLGGVTIEKNTSAVQEIHEILTHHQGILLMGIKKPLVKMKTPTMKYEGQKANLGKASIRAMSRAIQVRFRAMFTTTT